MRTNIASRFLVITLLFIGCGSPSREARDEPLTKEAMASNAAAIDADPLTADEDAFYWGRWAVISVIAPPPHAPGSGIGTFSTDPKIQQFNKAAIGAVLEQARAKVVPDVPEFLVMATVDSATHFFGRANLKTLDDRSIPVALTAVATFMLLQPVIAREVGQNQTDLYLQRTNLRVQVLDREFVFKTQMPSGQSLHWPSLWSRLFEACFERPPLILPGDGLRQQLWAWVDASPTITLVSADGTPLWSGKLNVP